MRVGAHILILGRQVVLKQVRAARCFVSQVFKMTFKIGVESFFLRTANKAAISCVPAPRVLNA